MAWLRAFHLVFVVAWFGGLFYLPRLFVYHALTTDAPGVERFKTMERKLFYGMMTPTAVIAVGLGLAMVVLGWETYAHARWFWVKVVLVAGLVAYHVYCGHLVRVFARDGNSNTHVFYRWFNEVPLAFLIAIVILAVVKPF
jgi:putative membrane protein